MTRPKRFVQVGQRIGRGVVIEAEVRVMGNDQRSHRGARLRCDCGTIYATLTGNLIPRQNGRINTTSCGCASRENSRAVGLANTKHGMHAHPLYDTWATMVRRCRNPSDPKWHRYGGRGIDVYESWLDVVVFIADIERILGDRPAGCTLDRTDNDGNYEPGNVHWATAAEQSANREYQVALEFLHWAREHHPDVVAEFGTRISKRL